MRLIIRRAQVRVLAGPSRNGCKRASSQSAERAARPNFVASIGRGPALPALYDPKPEARRCQEMPRPGRAEGAGVAQLLTAQQAEPQAT
jgi:hypothetical protein